MLNGFGDSQRFQVTFYTDAHVIRGVVESRQRRLTDILNQADEEFLVMTDVLLDDFGTHTVAVKADYAQVNLASVLFAVGDATAEAPPEMRTPKIPEQALISIPPFRIVGRIHLMPERALRDALAELTGRFIPVTEASYWSDTVGEALTSAPIVAFNHSRAQIMAPHRIVDPWEGINRSEAAGADSGPDAVDARTGVVDPWGTGRS
ncbi:MAG TPA: hypothetical protein VKA85_05255 [Candidatus Limnocylindrales bacterium]|nr:hypothetical protein [Candidatus Limnocylindrales bacterium]